MIRAKQISNLSSSARSFFLSGTRSSAADGSSCTSAEEESCVSKRQQIRTGAVQTGKRATNLAAGLAGNVLPVEVVPKTVDHFTRPSLLPQHVSSPALPAKADSVKHVSVIIKDNAVVAPTGDQIFKAGIGTVNFLSDIANYKVPLSDGTEVVGLPNSCMVDPSRPVSSVKSSNVKVIGREHLAEVSPKSASKDLPDQVLINNSRGTKGAERSGFVKGLKQASNDVAGKSFEAHDFLTNTASGKRKNMSQRSYTDSTRYASSGCD